LVKPISPYLLRPLRSLADVLRELGQQASGETPPEPRPTPPSAGEPDPAPQSPPKDSVTIAGVTQPVEPGEPTPPPTGGQLDVKA
jgi:hypothetical protein